MTPAEENDVLVQAAADPAFQRVLDHDPELAAIDESRVDPEAESMETAAILGFGMFLTVGGQVVPIDPLTPGQLALLWVGKSAFLTDGAEITPAEVLAALWVVIVGRAAVFTTPAMMRDEARQFFADSPVDIVEAAGDVRTLLSAAFRPLRRLPDRSGEWRGNADWLAGLVARVSQVTHLSPAEIIWKTPMATVANYDLQWAMVLHGDRTIGEEMDDESAIRRRFSRMAELAKEFLRGKKNDPIGIGFGDGAVS